MASFLSKLKNRVAQNLSPSNLKTAWQSITGQFPRQTAVTPPTTRPTPTRPGGRSFGVTGSWEAPTDTSVRVTARGVRGGGSMSPADLGNYSDQALIDQISSQIIELENKLANLPGMSLSDEEREAFLQKAIAQISPYYDKKKAEIEKSIEEGKIRSAQDVLLTIRDVRQEAEDLLKKYDIEEARTEEEFVNTLADITATEDEALAFKRDDWRQRIKNVKQGQVEAQTLTSGIGQKEIAQLLNRQQMEESAIQRRAGQARTEATTGRKYDIQEIAAAREAVERERIRRIGGPGAEAATTQAALERAGYGTMADLPSRVEIARLRGESPYTQYKPEALTSLAEERKRAQESRKLQLEAEEKAIRAEEERRNRQLLNAQLAAKQRELYKYM